MRKIFLILVVAIVGFSCKSKRVDADPFTACETYLNKYSETLMTYVGEPTKKNCLAYVESLDQMIKKCTIYTPVQKSEYQKELADARSSCNDM